MRDDGTLLRQKHVLDTRHEVLASNVIQDDAGRARLDAQTWEKLRALAPHGLRPILVRRNNDIWIAAYSVGDIGRGGRRIFLKGENDTWRLIRVKRSARVIEIFPDEQAQFDNVIEAQREYWTRMTQMVRRVFQNEARRKQKQDAKARRKMSAAQRNGGQS